jgi:F-box and WD-40 domain protein CDC4
MNPRSVPGQMATAQTRACSATDSVTSLSGTHSRSLSSNKTITSIPPNLLPSAPASPPTPAPSPTPHQRPPTWQTTDEDDDAFLLNARIHFSSLSNLKRQKFLEGILSLCDSQHLSFVSSYVSPRLRKDPFLVFPTELCLRVSNLVVILVQSGVADLANFGTVQLGTFLYR